MIDLDDIELSPWPERSQGQQVGRGPQGVKAVHLATGITVIVDVDRDQRRNVRIAMDALTGALTSPHYRGTV